MHICNRSSDLPQSAGFGEDMSRLASSRSSTSNSSPVITLILKSLVACLSFRSLTSVCFSRACFSKSLLLQYGSTKFHTAILMSPRIGLRRAQTDPADSGNPPPRGSRDYVPEYEQSAIPRRAHGLREFEMILVTGAAEATAVRCRPARASLRSPYFLRAAESASLTPSTAPRNGESSSVRMTVAIHSGRAPP
jgi:hypothetical protein